MKITNRKWVVFCAGLLLAAMPMQAYTLKSVGSNDLALTLSSSGIDKLHQAMHQPTTAGSAGNLSSSAGQYCYVVNAAKTTIKQPSVCRGLLSYNGGTFSSGSVSIGTSSEETLAGIQASTGRAIRRSVNTGGSDDDGDDDWGSGGSGAGGSSSGQPVTPIGDAVPLLLIFALLFIAIKVYKNKKRKKQKQQIVQTNNQTDNQQYPSTQNNTIYNMKKAAAIFILLSLTVSSAMGQPGGGGNTHYTITYKPGDCGVGTQTTGTTSTKSGKQRITLEGAIFTKTGNYVQIGWNTADCSETITYELSTEYQFTANTTLYPVFAQATFTVTYNAGDYGTGYVAGGEKSRGVAFTLSSSTFSRAGYIQTGWSTESDGSTPDYSLGGTYSTDADITLYPYWTALTSYTITYNGGSHGSGSIEAGTKYEDIDYTLSRSTFTYNENYVQDGWSTSDGGSKVYELGGTYSANASVTLYPHWANAYYVRGTVFNEDPWSTLEGKMYTNGTRYAYTMTLEPGTYEFKIFCNATNTWYGIGGAAISYMDYTNHENWGTSSPGTWNIGLIIGITGTYTFLFSPSENKISVIYPDTKYYLVGEFTDNWGSPVEFSGTGNTRIAEVTFAYGATANQEFKIKNNYDEWYGNNGTISDDITGWTFSSSSGNCKISPACAGTYRFTLDVSTMKLSVAYPVGYTNGYYIVGDFNDWTISSDYLLQSANSTISISLPYETTYEFYLVHSCTGTIYSKNSIITSSNSGSEITGFSETDTHCKLTTKYGGEYVIKLASSAPAITVYYPSKTDYYISGNFNSWVTGSDAYCLTTNSNGSGDYSLGLQLDGCINNYEFKFIKKSGNSYDWYGVDNTTLMYSVSKWGPTSTGVGVANINLVPQNSGIYTFTYYTNGSDNNKYSVEYPSPFYALMGDFNSWSRCDNVFPSTGVQIVYLNGSTYYDMQIISAEGIYGTSAYSSLTNALAITESVYDLPTNSNSNNVQGFRILTTDAGYYSFAFDFTNHTLTIIYPDVEQVDLCLNSFYSLPYGYTWSGDNRYISNNKFMALDEGTYSISGVNVVDFSELSYTFIVSECPYEYRIWSHTSYDDFYSNVVYAVGDSLSFFVDTDAAAYCKYQRRSTGTETWTVTGSYNLQSGKSVSANGIYHTAFTTFSDAADMTGIWTQYDGDLYVYNGNPNVIATFEEITPDRTNPNEFFDHTVVLRGQKVSGGSVDLSVTTGVTMGDDINSCISYADDRYTAQGAEGWDFVRYIYNKSDNHFQRDILKLGNDKYLYVNGSAPSKDYSDFTYIGDNKFEADFTANAGCNIKLIAYDKTAAKTQYLLYKTAASTDVMNVVGTMTSSFTMDMHIYYDFRTNKILHGWMPGNYSSSGSANTIDANLLIKRTNSTPPAPFASGHNRELTISRKTYFIQEFTSDLSSSLSDSYFFLCLPYAVALSDLFGMDDLEYKTNYTVQRYRGDKRAQYGDQYIDNGIGYWANLNTTATMQAGRGYEIGIYNIPYPDSSTDPGCPATATRRLVFPSASTGFVVKAAKNYESTIVAQNNVSAGINEAEHAHWNVLGAPGLISVTPYATTDNSSFAGLQGNVYPNFVYTWNGEYNDYTVNSITSFTFEPLMAYFVQYYGTIQWGASSTPAAMPRRTTTADNDIDRNVCDLYGIQLKDQEGNRLDRTYVSWSTNGTDEYDMMSDLVKIHTDNHAQLYTTGITDKTLSTRFAAQDVSHETNRLPLTLTLDEGEYTIALEEVQTTEALPAVLLLYDDETNNIACLTRGETYTFEGSGTIANRFYLGITDVRETPEVLTQNGNGLKQIEDNNVCIKFLKEGQIYILRNGSLYNLMGTKLN